MGTFNPELERDILGIILPYSKVREPVDVSNMVEALVKLLTKNLHEPKKLDSTASQNKNSLSDPGSTDNNDTTTDPSNSESEDSNSEDDTAQAVDSNNPETDNQPTNIHTTQAIQEALQSQEEQQDIGTQLKNIAIKSESQTLRVGITAKEKVIRDFGYTPQEIKASTQLVSKLSVNLRGLLQAQDMDHSKPGLSGNRIARNQVHKIKTGGSRLFLRRTPVKQVNTAIHILLDNSSSMRNRDRFEVAQMTTLAMIKALQHMRGINLALSIFPAVYPYYLNEKIDEVPVAEVLNHHQRPGSKILYPNRPKGDTPLAPSVRLAASRLCALTEPRKILLILTDGDPDSRSEAETAMQEAVELGIEVV
ncbi:MAG: hypothetical protein ABR533_09555, partial [Desulfonatronovibrio sp.]